MRHVLLRTLFLFPCLTFTACSTATPDANAAKPAPWDGMLHVQHDGQPVTLVPLQSATQGAPCKVNPADSTTMFARSADGGLLACFTDAPATPGDKP